MKKNILLFIFSISLGLISFSSCTDFDNLNDDPYNPKEEDYDFSKADLGAALRYGSNLDYIADNGGLAGGGDLFDRIKNNCWEPWAQYFVGGANPQNGWVEAYWKANYATWMSLLNGVIRDAALYPDRENSEAIARIWRVYMLSTFSDYFGPVPFSEDPTEPSPDYMSVQDLHTIFFKDLERAIDLFVPGPTMVVDEDFIFGGDILKWQKFANTQRFMLALKISEIDQATAVAEMKKSLAHPAGLMTSTADDAVGRWYDSWQNGPAYGGLTWNRYAMTTTMEKMITGIGGFPYTGAATGKKPSHVDPRAQTWFDPSNQGSNFQGVNVAPITWDENTISWISATIKADNRRPLDQLTYVETCFMLAEAVHRGFVSAGEAGGDDKAWYEKGVKASFARWGVSAKADDYLASTAKNGWGTSAKYDDTSGAGNTKLEKIVTQRYLGLFTDLSFHVWNDKRRLNLPAMDIPEYQNTSVGTWPRDGNIQNPMNYFQRGMYPQNEEMNNPKYTLVPLGGENIVTVPLWWASKKANYCTSTSK
ncbi:SusD/RagB family nutrient-binding outer membrane lipoprotein [Dysgonomonas macrotermitis]|uniref:Starch-binding associating with outer membrane n=1 Tax=Dysgonomonas macrotermitis TaxID=1346286 RepID=A0A1M5FBB2_9BACT|nr:SusD/RagB family nutrient-binding outer membrane lipoprotein [Dysgonomonas macrotermitis]SHF88900.1 Starch-binding associating with outer membrane [Dysgonomonas macrotermitis]